MTAELCRYGMDYDEELKGASVLGCIGDFSSPFLSYQAPDIKGHAYVNFLRNEASALAVVVSNPRMVYRWRYLNQIVGDWHILPFDQVIVDSNSYMTSNLVSSANIPLNDGVGDLEYYFTAELNAPYYIVKDYAFSSSDVGYGSGWTEGIFAITNRATYTVVDNLPSGGTDYFARIREGESNMEWVQLVGTLTITNEVAGSNEVYRLETPDGTVPRMTLVGDHSWRYHYQIPTNGVGGKLSFRIVTKEHYTNETDAATWLVRTNNLFTVEETVTEIPYTATLDSGNPNEISVVLDDSSTHLKIEYNDEQRAFSLSHAAYQTFNLWTDAKDGFRGNSMSTNGTEVTSNSGVSEKKMRSDAPFNSTWEVCPEQSAYGYWFEDFKRDDHDGYTVGKWFAVNDVKTKSGWTARNATFVLGSRDETEAIPGVGRDLAVALDGYGQGSVGLESFTANQLPRGLDTVSFTARIAQPIEYEDFAFYMNGITLKNYAISAKITMSQDYEASGHYPTDMSPLYPTISLVGYHRGAQGCYEFRMTRTGEQEVTLGLYKWTASGSKMEAELLKTAKYTGSLWPTTSQQMTASIWTTAYFLVYTMDGGRVRLEGHLAPSPTSTLIDTDIANMRNSAIWYVDSNPGILRRGGSYGVGSTDCRAGFGAMRIHTDIPQKPTDTTDAYISPSGTSVTRAHLDIGNEDESDDDNASWDYLPDRWEVAKFTAYMGNGCLMGVVPWIPSGYETMVRSFTTNRVEISPRMPGSWKIILKTGEDEAAGVVVDDVEVTPWEGVETWLGDGHRRGSNYRIDDYNDKWVYTRGWITAAATIVHDGRAYEMPDANVISVETDDVGGYAFVFDRPGKYTLTASTDIEIARVLLVGGGGAGGAAMGGGGGGGGVLEYNWSDAPAVVKEGKSITITVGAGGTVQIPSGTGSNATTQPAGNSGGNSSVSGITGKSVTAAKGGGGGDGWVGGGAKTGGSGGGGSHSRNGAAGTAGQGFAGGKASDGTGGGGGGAGSVGANATTSTSAANDKGIAGNGGAGKASDITGQVVVYGGGGGGGAGWQPTQTSGEGGDGGGGDGAKERVADGAGPGVDGLGGGGGGGTYMGANNTDAVNKQGQGARGGCGTVILRLRTKSRLCVLQPSRGKEGYPMGLRSPYIDEGMSLFSYSYENADSNCVMLVQIATNMTPRQLDSDIPTLTESLATDGSDQIWTTLERHEFKGLKPDELASGTRTTFISLRQHWIYDPSARSLVYTNVCGAIRVIVDPAIVSRVVNTTEKDAHDAMIDYGKITITKAYCYNEPALNMRSWFGFNVHTDGWDGKGGSGPFAFLTDWPDGLSIALNFSAAASDNNGADALGIGLAETDQSEVQKYAQQNPFVQCAALTNGVGTVSFRARLFDTNSPPLSTRTPAVITLYGSEDPSQDQPTTQSQYWKPLTNFVVNSPAYQAFEWNYPGTKSPYQAIRLEAAGARWGRHPSGQAKEWEWSDLKDAKFGTAVVQEPVNRVFIDEASVSELIVPRLKFLDVRPFRSHLGTEEICKITEINSPNEQPLIAESWGIQCRLEPQQMADELDTDSIRVWMEVYRGQAPWGYEQWKDLPKYTKVNGQDIQQRFTSELQRVSDSELVFRSYSTFPESIMPPEDTANTVYQYIVRAIYRDKSGSTTEYDAILDSTDWTVPEWYRGSSVGAGNASGDASQFSAYTILDAISPQRAWINEVNTCDAMDTKGLYQFIEFAVPQSADLKNWRVLYTDHNGNSASLFTFGVDDGVRNLTSKIGNDPPTPRDHTNHFQLIRPSGIVEHEIVVQGTNTMAGLTWGDVYAGTNLLAKLRNTDPTSQWIYAGEDKADANTTLGVFRSHGEDSSCWTNLMADTSTEINQYQEIPFGYFLEPFGTNVWIYSTVLTPQYMSQFFGNRNMGANAVIVVPKDTPTNIVFQVTNWYQIGTCTINGVQVDGARGKTGKYTLDLGSVSNTITVLVGTEPDDKLKNEWGLTPENRYTPAVLDWLLKNYSGYNYGPDDLSAAQYRDFAFKNVVDKENRPVNLSLTEMYWLNIPPVHTDPVYGGSNIWFVADMGTPEWAVRPGGTKYKDVDPYVKELSNGTFLSNIFVTVTMMITNTVTGEANPPDRLNGVVYDGEGSMNYTGQPAWTSVVFSITGALQKPDVSGNKLPLQQYVFRPDSFGAKDSDHPFQTRIDVRDPFASNSLGYYYGWPMYRFIYQVFHKFTIEDNPDGRLSISPLVPNWEPTPSSP